MALHKSATLQLYKRKKSSVAHVNIFSDLLVHSCSGGGLAVTPGNLDSLRTHALIVCLWASPETIYARVRHQSHRPLLQTPDPLARIQDLLTLRTPAYRDADLIVGVDFRSPAETARQIASSFRLGTPLDPS